MTGGASNAGSSSAYIGSQTGGGTIDVQVGGVVTLNGGTGTYGGVMICSIDDTLGATTVKLSAGKNIAATGGTGGVLLGVKNLTGTTDNSVALNAGWDAAGGGGLGAPSSFGGDITLTGLVATRTDASGQIYMNANDSSTGAYGSVSIGTGAIVYGGSFSIVAAGNNVVYGSLVSTGIIGIYLDAGWNDYAENSGKSSPEIAKQLQLSVKTVEGHRGRIMAKLDVHHVAGLVRHAIRIGLVSADS